MKARTKGVVAAVTGTALGVAGLAVIAMPASAGDAPKLPSIEAEELVASVLKADPPAFSASVAVQNDLGIPSLPGMELAEFESARVYHDGGEQVRVGVQDGNDEYTLVKNADGAWAYDSAKNTATRFDLPEGTPKTPAEAKDKAGLSDPSQAATDVIDKLSKTSDISVDGTARVADRPAYELVLTPKPTERTLLREVKVAIDSETRLPLRFEVMTNGSPEPILSIGFDEFEVGTQPAELFEFAPPKDAKIVKPSAKDLKKDAKQAEEFAKDAMKLPPTAPSPRAPEEAGADIKVVGDGWDMVVTGTLPEGALGGSIPGGSDSAEGSEGDEGMNPQRLLERFGKKVSGDFGSGYLITTKAGTGLVTDDGRFAAGAVPRQVLEEALATK